MEVNVEYYSTIRIEYYSTEGNSLTITIAFRAGGAEERISKEDETDIQRRRK
jgi:hypothetical protein